MGRTDQIVRVASTAAEAKVLVAILQAEGIPAYVDSASLADEFAMARQMMNLQGVQVRVPEGAVERACEVLANAQVDDVELEAQALAAAPEPVMPASATPAGSGVTWWALALVVLGGGAILFAVTGGFSDSVYMR
ncbi:MAG: hypothetical protein IPK26_28035 [Planctomycetes bacterium]|nr:hypothetical protein [Planctomycetota bacterium]